MLTSTSLNSQIDLRVISLMMRMLVSSCLAQCCKPMFRGARPHSQAIDTLCAVQEIVDALMLPLEQGAVPPLPQLFSLPGLLDTALAAQDTICFKTGNHHQLVRMDMLAFRSISTFDVAAFAQERDLHLKCVFHVHVRSRFAHLSRALVIAIRAVKDGCATACCQT